MKKYLSYQHTLKAKTVLALDFLMPDGTLNVLAAIGNQQLTYDLAGWQIALAIKQSFVFSKRFFRTFFLLLFVVSGFFLGSVAAQCPAYKYVSAGATHSFGIREDGTLWAWGANSARQLGDGTTVNKSTPVQIGTATNWESVKGGGTHSIGIRTDGTLWAWGVNNVNQLGDGTTTTRATPTQIGTATNWASISVSGSTNLAIKDDGTMWAWGDNGSYQCGTGNRTNVATPTQIGTSTWISVAVGAVHSLGIKSNGTLWAWGENGTGQLGVGSLSTLFRAAPTQIGTATNWVSVSGGNNMSFGIRSNGTLWAWGANNYGQLGDGTTTDKISPVQIGTATNWASVKTVGRHTVALKTDGTMWVWGANLNGELGNGTSSTGANSTPVQYGSVSDTWISAFGYGHTIALKSDGTVWTSGSNASGQIGDGTTTSRTVPTFISPIWTLANANETTTLTQTSTTLYNKNCKIITQVEQTGTSPINGSVTSQVWIENTQSADFVKRHYQIAPAANLSTATGRVTLYFTQQEFTDYNSQAPVPAYSLPSGQNDATGIGNLRIKQIAAVTSDNTGLPSTYSGAANIIDPDDANIVWNASNAQWAVTFEVTGFGGFFATTGGCGNTMYTITGGGTYCGGGFGLPIGLSNSDIGTNYQLKKEGANVGSVVAGTGAAISFGNQTSGTYTVVATNTTLNCTVSMIGSAVITEVCPAKALNFDGLNDYVTTSGTLLAAGSSYTKEAWINLNTTSGYLNIISSESNPFWVADGKLTVGHNASYFFLQESGTMSTNTWTHVAVTYNANTTTFILYKNGVEVGSSTSAPAYTGNTIQLGAHASNSLFSGSMDEVRIWSRVLSQCEIQHNMNCELGSGQTGLVAYYKFNQGTSGATNTGITSLTDASGNANTGTLTNFDLSGTTSNWVASGGVTTGTTCTTFTPYTWTGTTSTDWSNASNWSCGVVPTSTSDVTIPSTANKPILPTNQTVANLSLTGTNKVILGNSNLTVNAITGGSSTAYIVTNGTGALTIKNLGTNATFFPVGPSETVYAPVTITNNVNRDFTVKVGTTITNPIANYKYVNLQWDITPSVLTGNTATLALGWSSSSQASGFNPASAVQVNHYNGTAWDISTSTTVSGSDPYLATATGISSFSPFSISNSAVLSVELLDFKATPSVSGNLLTWTTANEVNNKGFQVERLQSTGNSWNVLGFVSANGKVSTYEFMDNTPLSTSYYRLRQIDNDGKETFSRIISIDRKSNSKLKIYPNPVSNTLTIETDFALAQNEANRDFQIINLLGQQVLNGKAAQRIDVSALPQGTYFLKVGAEQVKFIKQ